MVVRPPMDRALTALRSLFGFEAFRPGQAEAVQAALSDRDALVVMPTGAGKSLCYQLPALMRDDLTVVVSPLVSLMQDQVEALERIAPGRAALVNAQQDAGANRAVLERARAGEVRLLYIAPERFSSPGFAVALRAANVGLFVVDEAHCVSQWGHDFRPDYFRLADAARWLGARAIMASTATATPQVAADVVARLRLEDPVRVTTGFDRPNLSFAVVRCRGAADKRGRLAAVLSDPDARPAIVYAGTRAGTEDLAGALEAALGVEVAVYHAGLGREQRAAAQRRFMAGEVEVVVATNAFGMGVDKADVRSVIHWAIPKSVEAYYQEVGRGGRVGDPARAILLASRADLGRLINFIKGDAVQADDVLAYVARLRRSSDGDATVIEAPRSDRDRISLGVAERARLCRLEPAPAGRLHLTFAPSPRAGDVASICRSAQDRAWRAYRAVEAFSSASGECRRRTLLAHFGDRREPAPSGRCCDVCDPGTIGLPDPASLTPIKRKRSRPQDAAPLDPAGAGLLETLRQWRVRASDGKPAYTIAHNSTLETIASQRPSSLAELADIKGIGPAFVQRHGEAVLAIVGDTTSG